MAKQSKQERHRSQQKNETKDEQDSANNQAHAMTEPHAGPVEGPETYRADESQDEECREDGEDDLQGQVRNPGAAPEHAGNHREEEDGDGGEFFPLAWVVFEFEPHGPGCGEAH